MSLWKALRFIILVYFFETSGSTRWPSGSYGLPKALSGCPYADDFEWLTGRIYQDTENTASTSRRSTEFHLDAEVNRRGITRAFCLKTSKSSDDKRIPWPQGKYCVYKKGNACPLNLSPGGVKWDDENTANMNRNEGTLPDGIYDSDTYIEYCCSTSGDRNVPISLPTLKPFFLLAYGSAECQQVKWAVASQEWIRFDNEDRGNTDSEWGLYPHGAGIRNHNISYCYYRGCSGTLSGESGTFYSPNYPRHYPNGQYCSWRITVNSTQQIHLNFTHFDLQNEKNTDIVALYDGEDNTGKVLGEFYGRYRPPEGGVLSTSNHLFVLFKSDKIGAYTGFSASYKAVDRFAVGSLSTLGIISLSRSPAAHLQGSEAAVIAELVTSQTKTLPGSEATVIAELVTSNLSPQKFFSSKEELTPTGNKKLLLTSSFSTAVSLSAVTGISSGSMKEISSAVAPAPTIAQAIFAGTLASSYDISSSLYAGITSLTPTPRTTDTEQPTSEMSSITVYSPTTRRSLHKEEGITTTTFVTSRSRAEVIKSLSASRIRAETKISKISSTSIAKEMQKSKWTSASKPALSKSQVQGIDSLSFSMIARQDMTTSFIEAAMTSFYTEMTSAGTKESLSNLGLASKTHSCIDKAIYTIPSSEFREATPILQSIMSHPTQTSSSFHQIKKSTSSAIHTSRSEVEGTSSAQRLAKSLLSSPVIYTPSSQKKDIKWPVALDSTTSPKSLLSSPSTERTTVMGINSLFGTRPIDASLSVVTLLQRIWSSVSSTPSILSLSSSAVSTVVKTISRSAPSLTWWSRSSSSSSLSSKSTPLSLSTSTSTSPSSSPSSSKSLSTSLSSSKSTSSSLSLSPSTSAPLSLSLSTSPSSSSSSSSSSSLLPSTSLSSSTSTSSSSSSSSSPPPSSSSLPSLSILSRLPSSSPSLSPSPSSPSPSSSLSLSSLLISSPSLQTSSQVLSTITSQEISKAPASFSNQLIMQSISTLSPSSSSMFSSSSSLFSTSSLTSSGSPSLATKQLKTVSTPAAVTSFQRVRQSISSSSLSSASSSSLWSLSLSSISSSPSSLSSLFSSSKLLQSQPTWLSSLQSQVVISSYTDTKETVSFTKVTGQSTVSLKYSRHTEGGMMTAHTFVPSSSQTDEATIADPETTSPFTEMNPTDSLEDKEVGAPVNKNGINIIAIVLPLVLLFLLALLIAAVLIYCKRKKKKEEMGGQT
ncbi:uncharacterized protein [Montipora foliosa]|uniref:uncharacterized protein n=1 Tax=Montipora foliosa TaxID=591990 RepID=UPI0035F21B8D